jgi:hypothetical protein
MAKRRKKTMHHKRRRHSRVGAIGKGGSLMSSIGIIAGAVAGRLVVKTVLPNTSDKIKNAGVLALGFVLPKFIKSDMGKSIGQGMIAAGGIGLVSSVLPAIAGVDDMIEFPVQVSGIDDGLSVIAGDDVMAGDDTLSVLAGMGDEYDY